MKVNIMKDMTMQPALLLPTTTGTIQTAVVLLSAADDHACSFFLWSPLHHADSWQSTRHACAYNQSEKSCNFFFSECRRSRRKAGVANQDGRQRGSNPGLWLVSQGHSWLGHDCCVNGRCQIQSLIRQRSFGMSIVFPQKMTHSSSSYI